MNNPVTLFHYKDEGIEITIIAKFEDDNLIVDGYDIGKKVKDTFGDSDYEYSMAIPPQGIMKLCEVLNIDPFSVESLLAELKKRFSGNLCYTEINKVLVENQIDFDSFSWR